MRSVFAGIQPLAIHNQEEVLAFVPEEGREERIREAFAALLQQYPYPESRPSLFGMGVGVKDIFHVAGWTTRAGSQLPIDRLQGEEATVVGQLKAAGALILGKTVTTEFAYFAPGPTRNPYNLEHTPGGSSSGSAAAVAAGLCQLAIGTQTIGSINRPAAFCGVVGFKPSYDRVSRAGVIPLSPSLDHVGFLGRQLSTLLPVAAQTCAHWQPVTPDFLPVLGIPTGAYLEQASEEGLAHFRSCCTWLVEQGYVIQEVPAFPHFADIVERHYQLVAAEAAAVHAQWFAEYSHLYHPKTAELIRRGQTVSSGQIVAARQACLELRAELEAQMQREGVALWVTPAAVGTAPKGLESTGNPVMSLPWTQAGLPTVTMPAGFGQNGLPLGIQFVGRWYGDEWLLAWMEGLPE